MLVNLRSLFNESRQIGPRQLTTAHGAVSRFYSKVLQPLPRLSMADTVALAPSLFTVWSIVRDVERLGLRSKRFESAARLRVCQLRGHAPACCCTWSEVRASL